MPALLTSTSIRPISRTTRSTMPATASASAVGCTTRCARPAGSPQLLRAHARSVVMNANRAPCPAKAAQLPRQCPAAHRSPNHLAVKTHHRPSFPQLNAHLVWRGPPAVPATPPPAIAGTPAIDPISGARRNDRSTQIPAEVADYIRYLEAQLQEQAPAAASIPEPSEPETTVSSSPSAGRAGPNARRAISTGGTSRRHRRLD